MKIIVCLAVLVAMVTCQNQPQTTFWYYPQPLAPEPMSALYTVPFTPEMMRARREASPEASSRQARDVAQAWPMAPQWANWANHPKQVPHPAYQPIMWRSAINNYPAQGQHMANVW